MAIKEEVSPKAPKTKLELDAEYAQIRQQMLRKEAPSGVRVGKMWKNPLDAVVALNAPECTGKDRTHDAFTGDPDRHQEYLDQGYEPVIVAGVHVRNGRDLLYRRPVEFLKRHVAEAETRSQQRMTAAVSDETESQTLVDSKVEVTKGLT